MPRRPLRRRPGSKIAAGESFPRPMGVVRAESVPTLAEVRAALAGLCAIRSGQFGAERDAALVAYMAAEYDGRHTLAGAGL